LAACNGARPPAEAPAGAFLAWLYDVHAASVYRYLVALLGDRIEAEDALQTAFLELARRPDTLERMEAPAAYLLATARHAALRSLRRSALRRQTEVAVARFLEAREPSQADPEETQQLEAAIRELPVEQREVLVLKAFEGWTFRDIAEALTIPLHTAASRYRYALEKLKRVLVV
jgi:RNA polymerase sigma-70 factor (ECF subfamily)